MAAIVLNQQNIDYVKRTLRARYPDVKPSHIVEAFAAAVGYRTFAALLADYKASPKNRPCARLIVDNAFCSRLRDLGYPDCIADELPNIVRSNDLPLQCWREFPNRSLTDNNAWYRKCEQFDVPLVYIETRRKYVELQWDCITVDAREDTAVREDRNQIMRNLYSDFQKQVGKSAPGKPIFFGKAFTGSINNLESATAKNLADSIFLRLYNNTGTRDPSWDA